jgi:hypothetical protein
MPVSTKSMTATGYNLAPPRSPWGLPDTTGSWTTPLKARLWGPYAER